MKMREASEREANGAEKTEKKTERERELLICPELVLYSCMNSIFLHEQFMSRISFIQLHELHFFA